MGQRAVATSDRLFFFVFAIFITTFGCDRSATGVAGGRHFKKPTVASIVPAATDLLIGMGAGDHLTAISNWDADRPETAGLPKVGDYRTIDWERIASLHPDLLVVQFAPDKLPAGLRQRADQLGIKLLNVKNDSLADLYVTLEELGAATGESTKANDAARMLREQLDDVKRRAARFEPVTAIITRSEPGTSLACVGGGNYLDEILTLAGGRNVLAGGENSYPSIDRERLMQLDPQAALVLLPGASPQVIDQTKRFWESMPQLGAVRGHRVHILTESYLLLPGLSVGKVAEQFAERLHPTTQPAERR